MNICFQNSYQRAFGTFPLKGDVLAQAVSAAAGIGYRAFDTAQMYGNEDAVGVALAATPVTSTPATAQRGANCRSTKNVRIIRLSLMPTCCSAGKRRFINTAHPPQSVKLMANAKHANTVATINICQLE